MAHAHTIIKDKYKSRNRREIKKPLGGMIPEDRERSRLEADQQKRTRALLKKRVPGM